MNCNVTADSLEKFVHEVVKLQNSKPLHQRDFLLGFPNFFYRGQCNDYNPVPSIYRIENHLQKENVLYHELILRCPEYFQGLSHIDTLVLMQHYDLPTRLLDITSNPLVALYFACKDYKNDNEKGIGYVYVYPVASDYIAYSDSDRVLMLTCLPVLSSSDKKKILDIIENSGKTDKIALTTKKTYPAVVERLFHEITREVPAFKREIKSKDLITPIIVKPLRSNERIVRQDGAFIVSGLCKSKDNAEKSIGNMCGYKIKVENIRSVLQELEAVGINEAYLFPEIDKVASYLKENYKEKR